MHVCARYVPGMLLQVQVTPIAMIIEHHHVGLRYPARPTHMVRRHDTHWPLQPVRGVAGANAAVLRCIVPTKDSVIDDIAAGGAASSFMQHTHVLMVARSSQSSSISAIYVSNAAPPQHTHTPKHRNTHCRNSDATPTTAGLSLGPAHATPHPLQTTPTPSRCAPSPRAYPTPPPPLTPPTRPGSTGGLMSPHLALFHPKPKPTPRLHHYS